MKPINKIKTIQHRFMADSITLVEAVLMNIQHYRKLPPPIQPQILSAEEPKFIKTYLIKPKSKRSKDEQQVINAWRYWSDGWFRAEMENLSKLRLLFRCLVILDRLPSNNKTNDYMVDILEHLRSEWQIDHPLENIKQNEEINVMKSAAHIGGLPNSWRDPIQYAR